MSVDERRRHELRLLEERLNSQTKTLIGVLIASNATLAALAFAAARLS